MWKQTILSSLLLAPLALAKNECTIIPLGHGRSDTEQIVAAFEECGKGGIIDFPAPYVYTLGSKLLTAASDGAHVKIGGTLRFTDDIAYWLRNGSTFPIELQEQKSAWRFTGGNFTIDGAPSSSSSNSTSPDDFGMFDGAGQAWYSYSKGESNTKGRPMTLDFYDVENVVVRNIQIVQPQFWAIIVQGSKNVTFEHIWVNATSSDPNANGTNWVQNTDGLDTWRSDNIFVEDFHYLGGDDCIAFKGNSTNVHVKDVLCQGGPGIAFGSIGQYAEKPDYLTNITVENVVIERPAYTGVGLGQGSGSGIYFKSWIGVAVGEHPNGGGGGTGLVKNITIKDIYMTDIEVPVYITSSLSYQIAIGGSPNKYYNTSTLGYEDILFKNISGTSSGETGDLVAQFNCSVKAPCKNIAFEEFNLVPGGEAEGEPGRIACENVEGVEGFKCW